jgi:catechol 2,3-dioxygenase-like lactoylglutathione lyase family enzyme
MAKMEMKLELIQVPVSDIDRAKSFYVDKVGFNDDHDHQFSEEIRFVQLTPPGSGCSISFTTGAHEMEPGSLEGLQLVVEDADAVHAELKGHGVDVSDVQDMPWGRMVFFDDPDGNGWAVQQVQYPGRPMP